MNTMLELRYALRQLAKSPTFTVTAILSLAAGISGSAAIFSLADALLLRPRPGITNPATLVDIGRSTRGQGFDNFGYPLFEIMWSETKLLEGMAARQLAPHNMSLGDARSSERVFAGLVSGNYFEVVGTRPALGRFFLPEEDATADTHPVIVLSHEFWTRRFGADRNIVGQSVRLNSRPYTVVGVAEEGFVGTMFIGPDFWVPMAMDAHVRAGDESLRAEHGAVWMTALGRMKPGVTEPQVRDELQTLMHNYLKSRGDDRIERWGVAVAQSARVPKPLSGPVQGFVGLLAGLTLLVLLIACTNVAGMLLSRGIDRRQEFATRLAVGASRAQLVRQLLVEGLLLSLLAAAVSVPLLQVMVGLLISFKPSLPVPVALDIRVDPRVHLVTIALAGLAAIAFALLPALQSSRIDVAPALRGVNASADRRRAWLRQVLVCAQVAVALLLLVAAGLFLRSLQEAARADIGFNPNGVDTVLIDPRIGGYMTDARGIQAVEGLVERFKSIAGVADVAASRMVPLQGGRLGLGGLRSPGYSGPNGSDYVEAGWDVVSADYFKTLQMTIVAGRPFGPQDRQGAPFVAIVNETMARRLWPGQNPIGQTLIQEPGGDDKRTLQIVGVARDSTYRTVAESPDNFIYVPLTQQFLSEITFYVRRQGPDSRINALRQAVVAFDPLLPVIHAETLYQGITLALLPQRIAAWIAASVGGLGLFLAALGLYGLTAFSVSQRRREIAIRLAIGATPGAVVWLVLRRATILAVVGGAIGIALAAGLARLLGSFLVGLKPIDPLAFGLALAILTLVMFVAAWTPARRASSLDPVQTLRAE
jgi:predicted permease